MTDIWGATYNRKLRHGHDHGSAAYIADQAERRATTPRWQRCPSTHCERAEECRSPHECCGTGKEPTS